MKELYIAPELGIVSFAPAQDLAADPMTSYSQLLGAQVDTVSDGSGDSDEINFPIDGGDGTP